MIDAPNESRPYIGFERRRQMQIRGAFNAGLKTDTADPAVVAFLQACAEYLLVSMTRLDDQDMAILMRLRARVPETVTEVHEGLATLETRQAKARDATHRFGQSVAAFKDGRIDQAAFVLHAQSFADLIQGMMAPRRNPYEAYTNELFTDADWTAIAAATPEAQATERMLFAAVKALAPPGADPEAMSSAHGRPPGPQT